MSKCLSGGHAACGQSRLLYTLKESMTGEKSRARTLGIFYCVDVSDVSKSYQMQHFGNEGAKTL